MNSVCKSSSVRCPDDKAKIPVRATYNNLYRRPESDAEFVKSVVRKRKGYGDDHISMTTATAGFGADTKIPRKWSRSPAVVDSYSCRQMFLRSYTFSKEVSFSERAKKRFLRLKERPSILACLYIRNKSKDGDSSEKKKKMNNTKTYTSFRSIYYRLLACTATVDVID